MRIARTPNPATLKFVLERPLAPDGPLDFPSRAQAARSPLAEAIFAVGGVAGVFMGADFVTVTKDHDADWSALGPLVADAIAGHLDAGGAIVLDDDFAAHNMESAEEYEDDPIVGQIKQLLDERVRPAVAMDGGDIVFHGFERGVVFLFMQGACAGCPSSAMTLKMGIENLLKHYIPEVVEVRPVF